jgi:nucleoside phosphorylase
MCNHVYVASYKQMPRTMGKLCPYPALYERARSTAEGTPPPTLPVDEHGKCVFHSRDRAWKRGNDFEGHFRRVVGILLADPAAQHFDFAEFVFVGGGAPDGAERQMIRITDTVFSKQVYFTAASFLDSLALERVQFRSGANFRGATFDGDLRANDARFDGLDATRAEFHRLVLFTKVEVVSFALFGSAKFTGAAAGNVVKFEDSRFDGMTEFSDAAFVLGDESSVTFLRSRFEESADFSRALFHCQLVFSDVSFAGVTEFVDTSFEIIKSSARYRGSALEFNRIEVTAKAVLRFESSDSIKKLFNSDVQMSFKEIPTGLIRFENVNFKNIGSISRERLVELARLGRVEIGSGCIKYRYQTPITSVEISEGNSQLVVNLCRTFTSYFTVSNGFNLGFEVVERTSTEIRFFYFTDEDISEALFLERIAVTSQHMWSLLSVGSADQLRALEAQATLARPVDEESVQLTAADCIMAMIAIFFGAGLRSRLGRWKEADTRALWRATRLDDEGAEVARALHIVLVDRYTGATLFDINGRQHAGLILAYRDEPTMEIIDIAIVTAIEVERRAVCDAFGLTDEHRVRKDARVYWRGKLPLKNGECYEIVVAQAPDAANIDAAILTNDLLHHWKPGAALLVGIAASAAPHEVRLGDVVLGSEVYYYERGKVTPEGRRPEPKIISADATLWSNVTAVPDWNGKVPIARPDGSDARPKVHAGVIASGEKVIADAAARDEIAAGHRKIMAIEMEGYGFSRAVWQSFEHVRHLDIRAICDDGSKDKNDGWHPYAAAAAACFTRHFLLDRPLAPRRREGSRRS